MFGGRKGDSGKAGGWAAPGFSVGITGAGPRGFGGEGWARREAAPFFREGQGEGWAQAELMEGPSDGLASKR